MARSCGEPAHFAGDADGNLEQQGKGTQYRVRGGALEFPSGCTDERVNILIV